MDATISIPPDELFRSPAFRAEVAEVFIHHCLYMRQQIPTPFAKLRTKAQSREQITADSRVTHFKKERMARKLREFVSELEALLLAARTIFAAETAPDVLHLILGTSVSCPTEIYCLQFPRTPCFGPSAAVASSADVLKRRFIRHLVSHWDHGGEGNPRQLSIFLAVHVPGAESITQYTGDLFRVADSFSPRPRRRGFPPLVCRIKEEQEEKAMPHVNREGTRNVGEQQEQGKWYISRRAVRPLKLEHGEI